MVRLSPRRNHQKQNAMENNIDSIDQSSSSSSKILHVVRQALLNAAEELITQQEQEHLNENSIPFHTFDVNNNHDIKVTRPPNSKLIKKKKFLGKSKSISKSHRRK